MASPNAERIAGLKRDIVFQERLRGSTYTFNSTWGLFCPRQVDAGSRLLIENLDIGERQIALDLGCGYGPLGIVIASQVAPAEVHMVDRDYLAVDYAKKNAAANGLDNCHVYLSNAFSAVPEELRFDLIVSNLPAKTGGEMLSIILHDAHRHLQPGGRICLVTISGLRKWIKRNLLGTFGNYVKLKQGRSHTVALATRGPAEQDRA